MRLIVENQYHVRGKTCYSLNLRENNLPSKRKEIRKALFNKEVEIFDVKCKVIGIEMYATAEEYVHSSIGIMIEPIKD